MAKQQITVTVENLAPENGQGIAPFWFSLHDGSFDYFDQGSEASAGVEVMAEDGITGDPQGRIPEDFTADFIAAGANPALFPAPENTLAGEFASSSAGLNGGIQDLVFFDRREDPYFGVQLSGETAATNFNVELDPNQNRFFSYAAMLFPTNDGFIGNDDPQTIELFDKNGNFIGADFIIAGNEVWDAGTEVNDEDPANVPYDLSNLFNSVEENGVVHLHPGLKPPGAEGIVDFEFEGEAIAENADFSAPGYQIARVKIEASELPTIKVSAEPLTPISEAEEQPGRFIFELSKPAPSGGLVVEFQAGDTDPDPESRDVNIGGEGTTNIEDFDIRPIPGFVSTVTISEGATEAVLVVTPFIDDETEPDETISLELLPTDNYQIAPGESGAALTITEGLSNSISFTDIAADDGAGITYRRARSPRDAIFDELKQQPTYTIQENIQTPIKPRGAPGVAVFDYDDDGDLDIYVTNGPGVSNSLYSNQLQETGQTTFIDVAQTAGVAATEQDSNGVSYGDIDNDGDLDLLVLGVGESNQLFENQGNGTFIDISQRSNIAQTGNSSASTMGDVNGDGLLDIVVAGAAIDWDNQLSIYAEPFSQNQHNQLLLNQGDNSFVDVSESSGIQDFEGLPEGAATITWAIALVDYDLDGDLDLIHADDQAGIPPESAGGVDRGYIQVFNNDGTGKFQNVTKAVNMDKSGSWMGLSFGDFNADGYLDLFGSNLGDYAESLLPIELDPQTSRWFLGTADGSFSDPGVGELKATAFGWGTSTLDYDNDSDTDIVFHGGLDFGPFIDASNPGSILSNDGAANFSYDWGAIANTTDHRRRNVQGVATGDLNQDGFVDIVSVSSFDSPESIPLTPFSVSFDIPLDDLAGYIESFIPTDNPGEFVWSGLEFDDGTLSVELNSGNNDYSSIEVQTLGTVGLTEAGRVNRDGIGAVVMFTPEDGNTVMKPIVAGGSYSSQDSLVAHFGLGEEIKGTVDVLWPNGIRNRLYNVQEGDSLIFPEIPVSFDDPNLKPQEYRQIVRESLNDLVEQDLLTQAEAAKFKTSAFRAFQETVSLNPLGNSSRDSSVIPDTII